MNIAFCGKNSITRDNLIQMCSYCCNGDFDYYACENARNLLYAIGDGCGFDAIFIDLSDGMDSVKALAAECKLPVVAVAADGRYALESFEMRLFDYLVKPVSLSRVKLTMQHISELSGGKTYQIRKRAYILNLPLREIVYVESNNTRCIIHTADKQSYTIYKKLDNLEAEFSDNAFLRCHKSYLVNMKYVRSVSDSFTMTDGSTVCIRQRSARTIRNVYSEYISRNKNYYAIK